MPYSTCLRAFRNCRVMCSPGNTVLILACGCDPSESSRKYKAKYGLDFSGKR